MMLMPRDQSLRLVFDTHTISLDNEAGLAFGWFDVALSTTGEQQAPMLAELAEWNIERLQVDAAAGLDLKPFFFDGERQTLLGHRHAGRTDPSDQGDHIWWISVKTAVTSACIPR
jgi:hypothetical protein